MTRRCPKCRRPWRSEAAYRANENRIAVNIELRGGVPAPHLGPVSEPHVPKQERKRTDHDTFRRTGATA